MSSDSFSEIVMDSTVLKKAHYLLQLISKNHPSADLVLIEKAIMFADQAHKGQLRASGEPYIIHPIAAAEILAEQKFDTASIITALLHDTVEDTNISCKDIAKEFSSEIAELVDGVTKLKKIDYQPIHIRQAENFRKLLLAMSKDLRVLLVKLADRIHNMQTLKSLKGKEKHLRIAHETMEVYAPLAERMGMHQFKNELEDLAFAIIYPEIRDSVKNRLSFLTIKDKFLIKKTKDKLLELIKNNGLKAEVSGRLKTPYSIWRKMERKKITFDQLSDIIAFRIIVPKVEDCYHVLGIIHLTYKIIINGFKDYISLPKANGYKSLHTLVVGEEQQRIEIQIRTYEMDEIAKFGLAAHWTYKNDVNVAENENSQFKWINELIDVLQHTTNPEEIIENTRLDLYSDQVFCFTPKGDLVPLPKGATAIDFAFAMHSKIGFTCVGAKINGRIARLDQTLQNGDQVEIVTNPNAIPMPAWENFAITGKARSAIKKFIRATQQSELINLGRVILIKTLQKTKRPYNELDLVQILKTFQKKTIDDLLFAIGRGTINKVDVLQAMYTHSEGSNIEKGGLSALSILRLPRHYRKLKKNDQIPIQGLIPGMNSVFANCCSPLPGDKIIGIIHPAQGIVIHAIGCSILNQYTDYPERWISLSWEGNKGDLYIGKMRILLLNHHGALAQVTTCIYEMDCNISYIKVIGKKMDLIEMIFDIEVKGVHQFNTILTAIKKLQFVHSIERFINQK
ncbi:MAG: bifunctional (p)ppGpp synthetase/guanosine-3',5'-bis(diphosphate) 3'-pyrophosphohydrolase [Candidatus Midichloria sp.]